MKSQLLNCIRHAAGSLAALLNVALACSAGSLDLNPQLVGSCPVASGPNAYFNVTAVSGTRVYGTTDIYDSVADIWVQSLVILDISNPRSPTWLGSLRQRYLWSPIVVRGDYAYAPAQSDGLVIIDVSDASAPRRVGGYNTSGVAYGVFVSGNYAYVADGEKGLVVIDISNPASPRRVGGLDAVGEAQQVVVSGKYAFLADRFWNGMQNEIQEFGALRIIDISNPTSPVLVGEIPTEGEAWSVGVVGNTAYVGAMELEMFDITNPANPASVGAYGPAGWGGVLSGNRVYVNHFQTGLAILDISIPTAPRRLGGYDRYGSSGIVDAAGQYGYMVSANGQGLEVIDLAPPANLPRVGGQNTPGFARGVAVSGTRAYVADTSGGMQILDIANPRRPEVLGDYPIANVAELVAVNGNRAYVVETWRIDDVSYGRALHVMNVSDPASPKELGVYQTSAFAPNGGFYWVTSDALAIAPTGDYAFLSMPKDGYYASSRIEIIDLRTPADPRLVASYETSGLATSLAVQGRRLFVGQNGLLLLDVGDPEKLQTVGTSANTTTIRHLALVGNRAYAATSGGLQVFDLTDPAHPSLLGSNTNLGSTWTGLAVSGNYVYGAAGGSGVQAVEVGDPTNLRLVGGNSAALASHLAVSSNHVFVAGGSEGLQVFDLTPSRPLTAPALICARSSSALTITWPLEATNYVLEATASLPAVSWTTVTNTPTVSATNRSVQLPLTGPARFLRLRQP